MKRQVGDILARKDADECERLYARMTPEERKDLRAAFDEWAQLGQMPPPGDWRVWLILAGRGYGKTRAGAEWVTKLARRTGKRRIAIVGATIDEARSIMIEGPSGLIACADPRRPPKWEPSRGVLTYKSGAVAEIFSGEHPDGLRGPEHQYAWCDELAKWARGEESWANLMLGLRQGKDQRVVVTTTPRPTRVLKAIMRESATVQTGGRSADNLYLPKAFLAAVQAMYAGTRLGRQELDGELIEDVEGALWTRAVVEGCGADPILPGTGRWQAAGLTEGARARALSDAGAPSTTGCAGGPPPRSGEDLVRIVIGVDPPASERGDACGIVVCGLARDGIGFVLEDASVANPSPERWALAVGAASARWGADRIVAEANQGGDMVLSTLRAFDPSLPVTLVHASRGKAARAEPVSLLYAQGRVKHAGAFPELEDQMCGITVGGGYEGPGRSPDRADALVWALTELMLAHRPEPRIMAL
ncbi:DNA-packaging protein [Sphingomonas tabacisoli]|uniref:DNA-packaging protein n=1 Tax=Sphingomonas tabacisoli TaxID=2249466 RepID=A0ABW4I7W3_9SPHN